LSCALYDIIILKMFIVRRQSKLYIALLWPPSTSSPFLKKIVITNGSIGSMIGILFHSPSLFQSKNHIGAGFFKRSRILFRVFRYFFMIRQRSDISLHAQKFASIHHLLNLKRSGFITLLGYLIKKSACKNASCVLTASSAFCCIPEIIVV